MRSRARSALFAFAFAFAFATAVGCATPEAVDEAAPPLSETAATSSDTAEEPAAAPADAVLAEEDAAGDARRKRLQDGDALLASGDREGARAAWREITAPFARDAFGRVPAEVRDARIRMTFVGKPPPPIGPTEALGGEPMTWDSLRGRVVVAHSFWTYCNPCRSSMLTLDALAKRHGDRVVVVGLGAWVPLGQDGGRIPESREAMHNPVHFVETPDPEAFRDHLVAFRRVTKLSYPWLIQEWPRYGRWQSPENHPILLVDRTGVVAMAVRGPDLEPLEAALRGLLERQ